MEKCTCLLEHLAFTPFPVCFYSKTIPSGFPMKEIQ